MPIHQGLQHHHDVRLGHPHRGLHDHRLVVLINPAIDTFQPAHDRGRDHPPDALIDRAGCVVRHADHSGQPGHRLLDENIGRPTGQTGRTGPGPRPRAPTGIDKILPPPSSKNDSSTPTRSSPSTWAYMPARISSTALAGARYRSPSWYSGAGSARLSSFPLTVSGSASTATTAAGTM